MVYRKMGDELYLGLRAAAKLFNMREETFKEKMAKHKITMAKQGTRYFISVETINKWQKEKERLITFKEVIYNLIDKTESNYKKEAHTLLYEKLYCEGYDFWGARVFYDLPYASAAYGCFHVDKEDVSIIEQHLWERFYLFGKSQEIKKEYLLNTTELKKYKKTCTYIQNYWCKLATNLKTSFIEMVNCMRYTLTKELDEYSEEEILAYTKYVKEKLSKYALHNFIALYQDIQKNTKCNITTVIRYDYKASAVKKDRDAYDFDTYIKVAYMVYNSDHWNKNDMINKAIKYEYCAKLWLYHALLFICAWRKTDIISKVPRIELQDDYKTVFEKISKNEYTESDYKKIAYQIESKVNIRAEKPNKTKNVKGTSQIHLSVPESFAPVIGMLLMLCEAHEKEKHRKENHVVFGDLTPSTCNRFFGSEYEKLFQGKYFSTIKANKAYMKLIQGTEASAIDGYLLAAYARSHKINIDTLPEVTSRYLKAKTDHYSVNEITKALFERGSCSFIPYMLCDFLDANFKEKSICEQTEIMKEISYTPNQIETILSIDEQLEKKNKEKVAEIIKWGEEENLYNMILEALESVANGSCDGKTEGVYCIRKACKKGCLEINRKTCVGCNYEIYTRGFLYELTNEIVIQKCYLQAATTKAEYIKRSSILNERLYPALIEVLSVMKYQYGLNIDEYKELLLPIDSVEGENS